LNQAAQKHKISRDILLDRILILYQLGLKDFIQKKQKGREEALRLIREWASTAHDFEVKLTKILGSDDPVVIRFGFVLVILNNLESAIECNLKDNKPIDPDDMGQGC
jgi:hypothetical protein